MKLDIPEIPLSSTSKITTEESTPDDRLEEQGLFIRDALVLIESFFRTISGISDIRIYFTLFQAENSSIFVLKDQKLVETPSTPLLNSLITEMMKSRNTILFTDFSQKASENLGKQTGSSWLVSPISSANQIVGAIFIQGPRGGPYFAESDKQILASLTEPISNLFQNVFFLESTRKALETQYDAVNAIAKTQEDLARLTDKLLETLDVDLVLQSSVSELRELFELAEVEIQLVAD
ncbi:MAG: hypothetical protein N3D16_12220 [Anaerolineales bacterium]|nr:hypothetical protein [Anaerolineales bacterium]